MRVVLISIFVFIAVIILGILIFSFVRTGSLFSSKNNTQQGSVVVIKSIDGGVTWTQASSLTTSLTQQPSLLPITTPYDLTLLDSQVNKDDTLMLSGNSGALYISTNGATSWNKVASSNITLKNSGTLWRIASDWAQHKLVYVAYRSKQGTGVLKVVPETSATTKVFVGSRSDDVISSVLFRKQKGELMISTNKGSILQTSDGGNTWKTLTFFENGIVDLVQPNENSLALYAHTGSKLLKSTDGGATWNDITSILKKSIPNRSNLKIRGLVSDPNDSLTFYVATGNELMRSLNGGTSFKQIIVPSTSQNLAITTMTVHPTNPNILFIASGNTLYKSVDKGSSWQIIALPTQKALGKIVVSISNPTVMYATLFVRQNKTNFFPSLNLQ